MPRWTPYVAAALIVATVTIGHFAFPQTVTKVHKVHIDPYAKFNLAGTEMVPVTQLSPTSILVGQCEYLESRAGLNATTTKPRAGDVLVTVCTLLEQSLDEPVG